MLINSEMLKIWQSFITVYYKFLDADDIDDSILLSFIIFSV